MEQAPKLSVGSPSKHEWPPGADQARIAVVQRYQDRLFNALCYIAGSPREAQRLTEIAFVETLGRWNVLPEGDALTVAIYTLAMDALAASSAESTNGDGRAIAPAPHVAAAQAQTTAGADGSAAALEAHLAGLERLDRAVLVLREIDGYCYETIGEIVHLSVDDVRRRLCRARLALRPVLASQQAQRPLTPERGKAMLP